MQKLLAIFLLFAFAGCDTPQTTCPCPTPTASPIASPTPTPVASPSPIPSPTPLPSPTASPTPKPSPTPSPTPTPTPVPGTYKAINYVWPEARPYISLKAMTQLAPTETAVTRFMAMVDRWVGGNRGEYNYSPKLSVIAYALKKDPKYIQSAIQDTNTYVEAQIASACSTSTTAPSIATDSYLYAADYVMDIALTYDWGFNLITDTQKKRWMALMQQVVSNIWGTPSQAKWGGTDMGCAQKTISWSGWSMVPPNPGNNYWYRSFIKSSMLVALANKDAAQIALMQAKGFPLTVNYYSTKVNDGGSREGTGYGTAQMTLFEDYAFWKDSLNEDLSAYSGHTKKSIEYWIHATVPTLDMFGPIGDQSRSSMPVIYDYHRNLVHQAAYLSPGTPEAAHAGWWLSNISIKQVGSGFNLYSDLLPLPATLTKPTELSYSARGAGAYFARSSWEKDALWMSLVAGQFEESHAGQDQGGFALYKNGWLAVTSNIYSQSGIQQGVASRNVMRFEKTAGGVIGQNQYADNVAPQVSEYTDGDGLHRDVDLSVAYASNKTLVSMWKRETTFKGDTLKVRDTCTIGQGVRPVWQVHVPVLPVKQSDGSIVAGKLKIVPTMDPMPTVTIEEMRSLDTDYQAGKYRVSLLAPSGCDYRVTLQAL